MHSYMQADVNETGEYTQDKTGTYTINPARYAFIKSEYVIYTVNQTGTCDVYLAAEDGVPAVQVTATGAATSDIIPKSLRVGITMQDLDGTTPSGDEELVLVYAPYDETGKGNDGTGIDGWTYVADTANVAPVTYPHVYGENYIWMEGTDEQCVNNSSEEDPSTYQVTVSLAGVAK